VAAGVILATGWQQADPVASLVVAALILATSWRLLRESTHILMEAAPTGLDVDEIGRAMASVPGVLEVHDLHVCTVTSGFPALAAHVTLKADQDPDTVRRRVEATLRERFDLDHTTLQVSSAAQARQLIDPESLR
jgi:cobalt-zinc-cadmium efflux system protein